MISTYDQLWPIIDLLLLGGLGLDTKLVQSTAEVNL